jgi:hypothetical protein
MGITRNERFFSHFDSVQINGGGDKAEIDDGSCPDIFNYKFGDEVAMLVLEFGTALWHQAHDRI